MTCVPTCNISDIRGEWWLAQCRRYAGAPGEKLAAELLSAVGCTPYFPADEQGMPIMPGQYLFAAVTSPEQITHARNLDYKRHRTQRRILNCSRVINQEQLKQDLSRIQYAIENRLVRGPGRDLKPGLTRVEIRRGPYVGYQGIFVDKADRPGIVILTVEAFGQRGVPIEISEDRIEPLLN